MELREAAYALLRKNRRNTTDGYQYTVPSPHTYPYQWLWDSCFHSIVLAKFDPQAAIAELKALLSRQYPNGLLPHIVFWTPKITRPYNVGWKNNISAITQPPMVAYAAWEIYRNTNDPAFLKELFPGILAFYKYLIDLRDPHDHHLISIINPDESGEDNSPRFDAPMHVKSDVSFLGHMYARHILLGAHRVCNYDAEKCMAERFWVKDVPFNAILLKNLEILGHIASLLGESEAEHFASLHHGLIKDTMREKLFADGVYWSAAGPEHDQLRVATWAHFVPLFAGLYTKEEAEVLIHTHFNNPETFRSPYGIRTVSKKEPSYRSTGFWRGPIWFAPHWFLFHGLKAYGFDTEASWIRDTSVALIEKNGFREFFSPETGKPYGARDFTWGTLVVDMLDT